MFTKRDDHTIDLEINAPRVWGHAFDLDQRSGLVKRFGRRGRTTPKGEQECHTSTEKSERNQTADDDGQPARGW